MRKSLMLFLFCVCFPSPSFAINNIENERLSPVEEGLSGKFQANIDGKSGNSDKESFDIGAKGIYKFGTNMFLLMASREYGKSFDQTNTDTDFLHLRFVREHNSKLSSEYFIQNQSNPFKRLAERFLLGAGGRFNLINDENQKLIIGSGAFYAIEEISDSDTEEFWRANFYLVYKQTLNNQISFLSTIYLQPRLGELDDLEALSDISMSIKLSTSLSLKVALKTTHDRKPPSGVATTDNAYGTSLVYSF